MNYDQLDILNNADAIVSEFNKFGITEFQFNFLKQNEQMVRELCPDLGREVSKVVKIYEYHAEAI